MMAFNRLKKWLLADDISSAAQEINRQNYYSMKRLALISVPISLLSASGQYMVEARTAFIFNLLLEAYFLAAAAAMYRYKGVARHAVLYIYLFSIPVLLFALLSGTILDRTHTAFYFFVYLSCMTLVILDRPWRVLTFLTAWSAAFVIMDYACKPPAVAVFDEVHLLTAWLCTFMTVTVVLTSRLNAVRSYQKLLSVDKLDEMTGLYNRKYFINQARNTIESNRLQDKTCIVYYDINGMRGFNQEFGFEAGDELLKQFARILSEECGQKRLYGRFGEDHFVVLLDYDEKDDFSDSVYDALNRYLRQNYGRSMSDAHEDSEESIQLGLRAGICRISRKISVQTACDRARIACHSIRPVDGKWREYDRQLEEDNANEEYVLSHLDQALRNHWIKVYYQPVIRAMTDQLCSEEALARWDDPTYGLLAPNKFIPVLEKHRLLYAVDLYMCDLVLQDFRRKEEAGWKLLPVSINLSRNDFDGRDMVKLISDKIDRYGYDHHLLIIEITESAYSADPAKLQKEIERFHEAGFQVWMDDFGSGYSSLNMLQDSHFDLIKLDMRFMHNFGRKNEMITGSVISMANRLGIDTLAEGVETAEQRRFLRNVGCGRIQGYYYCKPEPLEDEFNSGLSIENADHSSYLEKVSRVDLSSPFAFEQDPLVSDMMDALPCSIAEWHPESEDLVLMRANESYQKAADEFLHIPVDYDAIGTARGASYHPDEKMADAVKQCIETGRWSSVRMEVGKEVLNIYTHEVGKHMESDAAAVMIVLLFTRSDR